MSEDPNEHMTTALQADIFTDLLSGLGFDIELEAEGASSALFTDSMSGATKRFRMTITEAA